METRLGTVTTGLGDEEKGFDKAETAANSYQEEIEKVNKGINFQNTITAIDNVTEKIEAAAKKVANDPAVQAKVKAAGSPVEYLDADEFQAYWDKDDAVLRQAVQNIGKVQ